MSLLDDVSIVVTPNGYKAGELYAVIPVPTEGAEEVTNGDFNGNANGWTLQVGWSYDNNNVSKSLNSASYLLQSSILTIGVRYKITFTISNYVGGNFGLNSTFWNEQTLYSSNGTFEVIAITKNSNLYFFSDASFVGTIDNVSVKEFTASDMDVTRATAATRVDENGLVKDVLSNVPRIDYTGGGCPHILAEPQRTNLITESEDFSGYSQVTGSITANSTTSPDGTLNGSVFNALVGAPNFYTRWTATVGLSYAQSIFLKKGTRNWVTFVKSGGSGFAAWFDLENGVIGTVSSGFIANMENYGNGWYRCSVISNATLTVPYFQVIVVDNNDLTTNSVAGTIFMWGTQAEQGSYPTSYIPTSGSAVTRNQDVFTRDGIGSLINSTEGVLFAEMAALSDDGTDRRITLSDGSVLNQVIIGFSRFASNINAEIHSGGVLQTSGWGGTGVTQTNNNKFALSWGSGTMKFYINGSPISPQTGITSPIGLNSLKFSIGNDTLNMFAEVKQLQVYKTALTDAQLTSLTT